MVFIQLAIILIMFILMGWLRWEDHKEKKILLTALEWYAAEETWENPNRVRIDQGFRARRAMRMMSDGRNK